MNMQSNSAQGVTIRETPGCAFQLWDTENTKIQQLLGNLFFDIRTP